MTRTQQMITAFWVFVIGMLLWEFYDYNQGLSQSAKEHPQQTHFYFVHTNGPSASAPAPVVHQDAFVEQVHYEVKQDEPEPGSFTVYATLKNTGHAKATSVQLHVRPYRGMRLGDEDAGDSPLSILPENDPLSQFGTWLSFPDLDPGQSDTESTIFLNHPGAAPVVLGKSDTGVPGEKMEKLTPEINFDTAKPAPK